jgi:nucleoside-diphosphate-sugar epimerase
MRVLFIGGTGFISSAVSRAAIARGIDLYVLNRGMRAAEPAGARALVADIQRPDDVRAALKGLDFDVVVDWIAFTPDDIERDVALFGGKVGQYVFISSASAYQKPPDHYLVTEETPLSNPYWAYSRGKIACEERLMRAYRDEGLPVTIVRPSLTYDTNLPIAIGGWGCYTLARRAR